MLFVALCLTLIIRELNRFSLKELRNLISGKRLHSHFSSFLITF